MTHQELFDKCAELGRFPKVENDIQLKHASSKVGTVTEIKEYGVGVKFPGMNWNAWFWSVTQDDKRSKYMSTLKIIE